MCVSHVTGGFLHELSNEGARKQFLQYLEDLLLPQMVLCAQVNLPLFQLSCISFTGCCNQLQVFRSYKWVEGVKSDSIINCYH